ncbi:MAG: PAS domain S-box protein [Gemmatimonadota bacterium]|nr:PAS domain S-box protein [Gemmatimonadota bacterium]
MLHQSYDPLLVLMSILVASLAGFAALDLSARVAAAAGWRRAQWVGASALAMGVGIWSMHFIAMLALRVGVPVSYNAPLLVLSVVIAISASAITFTGASTTSTSVRRLAVASIAMGPAIAGMHYTGMAAMRMPARITYDIVLVALSIAIAISASFAALLLARHFRRAVRHDAWLKIGAGLVMGAAVYGMHYTGMVAARFHPAAAPVGRTSDVIATESLAWAIAGGAFVVISLAILAGLADRRILAARARTDAILDSALDAIITIDERGRVLEFNPAAERTFGYTRTQAIGRELADLIIPEHLRPAHRAGLERFRRTGEGTILGRRVELPARTADGGEILVELAITRIPVGDPPVFTGFLRDITERKRMEEAARRHAQELRTLTEVAEAARAEAENANRAKSDFLAAMSHDLRTPLNAIQGYVDLLELELRGPITDKQRHDLNRIGHNQRLLLSLINDVLNFAKLEAGRLEIKSEPVPVSDLLTSLEPLVAPQLQAKRLSFESRCDDQRLITVGDGERIKQILLNLLSNAIKFTPPGGQIAVGASPSDTTVRLWVRDTGRGIPADKRDVIFDPFVQVGGARPGDDERQGVGLGLAISRELARAMGGNLTVESTEGEGSTFTLSLRMGSLEAQGIQVGGPAGQAAESAI